MSAELLVPLDGSSLADAAVAHAAEIARRVDGSLHLVRVHTPLSMIVAPSDSAVSIPDPVLDEQMRTDACAWLKHRATMSADLHEVPTTFELRLGLPESEIALAVAERKPRLVVCTTRGAGTAATRWLGSVADAIIRHVRCPVFAMSPAAVGRDVRVRAILVLLDGSEASRAIIPHATWLAGAFAAQLDYLQLTPPPGHPARAILEHVEHLGPDVVALATHGRGVTRLFLGGIADELIHLSERPVLVLRPRDVDWTKSAA